MRRLFFIQQKIEKKNKEGNISTMSRTKMTRTITVSDDAYDFICQEFEESKDKNILFDVNEEQIMFTIRKNKIFTSDGRELVSKSEHQKKMSNFIIDGELEKFKTFFTDHHGHKTKLFLSKKRLVGVECATCDVSEGHTKVST